MRRRGIDLRLWVPLGVLVLTIVACFVGPMLLGPEAGQQALGERLAPPAWLPGAIDGRPLGTDAFGRDMLTRTLEGGQVSLQVGFGAATGAVLVGMVLGLVAGYWGGWCDRVIMAGADIWLAFPFLVIALAAVAVVGSDIPVLIVLLTLGGWVLPTRVTRTIALRVRSEDYVVAAAGAGASDLYLVRRHVLPQVLPANLVVWSFTVGALVVIEGALSFLGLGVKPPTASWGNIIADGTPYLQTAWWIVAWPALMIVVTVICANALGNALRGRWNAGADVIDKEVVP
ncbi:ABC transporter permease [Mumia zhuanghuii]|uniref:ABC transporter permease n=2 Tax=Mumia TaxID=1546255 RepID=A0ABW1QPH1_9ACTN|nr:MULTISPECIES: ABC transporter permease [Mumia]KAA1423736.1 ABC transporter permease [Mumia zhuanghuii]